MADIYGSMTELMAHTERGVDWRLHYSYKGSADMVIAPHGGGIEVGTSEITRLVHELTGCTYYDFESLRAASNADLHVTSTRYDEPIASFTVPLTYNTISIHGASGDEPVTYIGGLDIDLRTQVARELTAAGFIVDNSPPREYAGTNPANIVNRNAKNAGVQLELTTAMRRSFFRDGNWARSRREDKMNWTNDMYRYANALARVFYKQTSM